MSTNTISKLSRAALLCGAASLFMPHAAYAAVDEMVVTVRKRAESMQTIPLAISAITSEELERARVQGMADIAALTPGLSFQTIGNGFLGTPTIRGLAQTNIGISPVEKNVAVFLDGIYISAESALDLDLLDLERVEVVKGPQSALYGRNAFAGTINYVPAGPGDEFSGSVTGTIGSDELYEVKTAVGGPIVDGKLGARVALGWSEFDGTYKNTVGDNLQGFEKFNASGVVEFTPADNIALDWFGYYADKEVEQSAMHLVANNCGMGFGGPSYYCGDLPFQSGTFDVSPDSQGLEIEMFLTNLRAEIELDAYTLVSVTGYADVDESAYWDGDLSSGAPIATCLPGNFNPMFGCFAVDGLAISNVYQGSTRDITDFSQELRLEYKGESTDVMVGGFYYKNELDYAGKAGFDNSGIAPGQMLSLPGFLQPLVMSNPQDIHNAAEPFGINEFETETWSVFGRVAYDFTDQLTGAVEMRYTHEDKSRLSYVSTPIGAVTLADDSDTFNFLTPRFTLDYQHNDNQLYYASIAKGVRAGGFNTPTGIPQETSYGQESNWTYEIGAKTNWMDDRLQLNAAFYYVDWEDLQITALSQAGGFVASPIQNVGAATSIGLELAAIAQVTKNFEVRMGYAYSNPEFDDNIEDRGISTHCGIDMVSGSPTNICNFNAGGVPVIGGNQLGRTHEHMANLVATYAAPLTGDWDWYVRGDVSYLSEMPIRSMNVQFVPDRTVANARIGVERDNLEISLWAKNIFDEDYVSHATAEPRIHTPGFQSLTAVVQGDGRTIGATASFRF